MSDEKLFEISRRGFLQTTAVAVAAVPAASGCGNQVDAAPLLDVDIIDDPTSAQYGMILVSVPSLPDLQPIGGAITLKPRKLPPGTRPFAVPADILLIHRADDTDAQPYAATSATCPHAGCPLGYSAKDKLVECPCHGSRFRAVADPNISGDGGCAGAVTHLPARAPLDAWVTTLQAATQTVAVDLNQLVTCGGSAFPAVMNGKITFNVGDFPALGAPGGSITGKPAGLSDKLIIVRVDATNVAVLSSVCTHMQCDVLYTKTTKTLDCPCHDSGYNLDGAVLRPPAPSPLKKYAATFDGTTIVITV